MNVYTKTSQVMHGAPGCHPPFSPICAAGKPSDRLVRHNENPKPNLNLHCGNWRKWRRHLLRWPHSDGETACISFSPPRLFLCIRDREKKGRGMEWRNHACFCPPLSVMNNLAVQGPRCRVEMVVMGRLDIYGMARSNGLR